MFVLVGLVLTFGGCLQDAHNANNDFNFNNPADPTPTNSSGINIAEVDTSLGVVTLVNSSGISQDMTSWTLSESSQTTTYTFPSAFALGIGSFVRVHTLTSTDAPPLDLYGIPFALTGTQTLNLNNGTGTTVSSCVIGTQTCH